MTALPPELFSLFSGLGGLSPKGFVQRLEQFAAQIETVVAGGDVSTIEAAAEAVVRHAEARRESKVAERVKMCRRLLRWLSGSRTASAPARSFGDAAIAYAVEGAWVDWARMALRGGESIAALSRAYEAVFERARQAREKGNERFARLFLEWNYGAPRDDLIVPVEEVLERVVAPVAAIAPVLMLVLDGVSLATFYELLESLAASNWTAFASKANGKKPLTNSAIGVGIAALPTITEVSRASLLAGALTRGTSSAEKQRFAANQALVALSKPGRPPLLFHKGELTEAGGTELAQVVRDAIASSDQRVVGVVVNAVDDQLSGSEQVRPNWSLDCFSQPVQGLMREALAAGRLVVFASDHGHVLDADSELRRAEYGDRWRGCEPLPEAGELTIRGGRLNPAFGDAVVCPWSERIRYSGKKNGYHSGISPQEVVVPVMVAGRTGSKPDGWGDTWPVAPSWWEDGEATRTQAVQGALFRQVETTSGGAEWIERLLKSRAYKAQRETLGRGAPADTEVRQLIEALATRGGKLTLATLAQRLKVQPVRVVGRVAAVRRVLNLEGYAVLKHDYGSDTVELDVETLRKQFEL